MYFRIFTCDNYTPQNIYTLNLGTDVIIRNEPYTFLDIKKAVKEDHHQLVLNTCNIAPHLVYPVSFAFFRNHFVLKKYKTGQVPVNLFAVIVKTNAIAHDLLARLKAQWFANLIASEPANKMYPQMFCDAVQKKMKGNVTIKIFDEKKLKSMGFGLILSVGQSSKVHPPRLLMVEVGNGPKTVCVIGKGVIFDSGGYNLKPSRSMAGMHFDKAGGALAVSLAQYFSKIPLSGVKIVAIVPLVENLIGQRAQKVGDIQTAYNGKTVEILSTDAEGRLALADSLSYACEKYKPDLILDYATLTGWSSMLHCDTSYVYYTQNEKLANLVHTAGIKVGERSIRLPNWPEYIDETQSKIADLKNHDYDCRGEGFMATMFLANFIPIEFRDKWVHFDMTHVENKHDLATCNGLQTGIDLVKQWSKI